jgi:hypothetical protein
VRQRAVCRYQVVVVSLSTRFQQRAEPSSRRRVQRAAEEVDVTRIFSCNPLGEALLGSFGTLLEGLLESKPHLLFADEGPIVATYGRQLMVFGLFDKLVDVPEYLTKIVCACPFFKLAGTANLNP